MDRDKSKRGRVMRKTYELVIEVALEEADEEKAIEVSRNQYRKSGPTTTPVGGRGRRWRKISAENSYLTL